MSSGTKACRFCGEEIQAVARKCRHCGEYLDEASRKLAQPATAVDRMLLPVGRPASAIAAGYLGLFALFPLIGLLAAPMAIVFGVMAIKKIKAAPALSGQGRAWFGIVTGTAMTLLWGFAMVALVYSVANR